MIAGNRLVPRLKQLDLLDHTTRVRIDLYRSLALTGRGHATDTTCILGLMAETPSQIEPDNIQLYAYVAYSGGVMRTPQNTINLQSQ
jgi:L-serine dehydratase